MKSDVEELMPRLLPVDCGEGTEDVDLSGPPRNPQEYLRQVQLEASLCPDVVVAQIDPKKLKKTQTVNASPKLTDEEGWKRFCLGEKTYLGSSSSILTEADQEPALDYSKVGFPPLLSIVSRFNQSMVLMLLDILISWFEEREFVPQLGRWLYALLACLEKPLLPEAHSSIRQLARRCAHLRSTMNSQEDEDLPALNLLICLVARYFEQVDLADQPE
ncbi:PREDICTED: gem-associated protein 2 isoform X2 [Poecilia mexicana]|uniref:gem-associated protein 2 isoform X2 n=1 Tax=Poecilia mexicana TaxID=48701 RepID=UPI00072D9A71|nr:PREDICTED: gem-associated protein 2 isoform X2 [Poecilia mexicana]